MPIGFIFFDMDETLGFFRNYDGSMNSEGFPTGIFLRRYIKDILEKLNKDFVLFITTAATLNYTKAVLDHSDLAKYFHGIFTRNDFVKLENATDANKEASPGGYEKRYSRIMKHYGIKMNDAVHGLIIGDNDYDISCDMPGLRTFIVDSLFVPADILNTVIRDIFDNKNFAYDDLGIKILTKESKHPIANLETTVYEIECPDNLLSIELEKLEIILSDKEKLEMKVQQEEIITAEKLSRQENNNNDNELPENITEKIDLDENKTSEENRTTPNEDKNEEKNKNEKKIKII